MQYIRRQNRTAALVYRLFFLQCCIVASILQLSAQTYSNNWVSYSQKYYKIPIVEEGIYRIYLSDLTGNDVPTGEFQPRNLQLYHGGVEQAVFVKGESDGIFHSTDYIEFYANRNTGIPDTALYESGTPLNSDYSLYNDTAYYFLTWNTSTSNSRMTTLSATNYSSYTAETNCFTHSRYNYTAWYNSSNSLSFSISDGEGFVSSSFSMGSSKQTSIVTDNYYDASEATVIELCLAGNSKYAHDITITAPGFSKDTSYTGYIKFLYDFETNESLDSVSAVKVASNYDATKSADNNCISYIDFYYTRDLNVEGLESMKFNSNSSTDQSTLYYNFENTTDGLLYNLTSETRVVLSENGDDMRCLIDKSSDDDEYFFSLESAIKTPEYIKAVHSKNSTTDGYFFDFSLSANQGSYIIITHADLWSGAKQYNEYRESTGHDPVLIDVEELYNQFGYGILKHPGGIKHFLRYALNQWSVTPENLFFIGKGIQLDDSRTGTTYFADNLVPAFGYPSSDILYTTSINSDNFSPLIPTGRIAAKDNDEVVYYLDKVKEYESASSEEWMKTVLHFGGGSTTTEQATFKKYLAAYEEILEGQYFAGNVYTFLKESSDPIEITESEYVQQLVNDGTTLMNFFGHASGEGFDQNIDEPDHYENEGKYPFIIANSCYAGDIFDPANSSISETWMLIDNKGAIGFLGGVAVGYDYYLNRYSERLIRNIANLYYGKSIGICMQKTINTLAQVYGGEYTEFACMNFTLHGDPAIVLNYSSNPDIMLESASISFDPSSITSDIDSMTVMVDLKNIGMYCTDTFLLEITHTMPDEKTTTIVDTIEQLAYLEELEYRFPLSSDCAGINLMTVSADTEMDVNELNETNNDVTVEFLVSSSDLVPIIPYEYAIVPDNKVTLKASPVDPLAEITRCIIEIDSTEAFNSTLNTSSTITLQDGLAEWEVPFQLQENVVYYWRVKALTDDEENNWNESSFTYIDGKTGWSQADFYQFGESEYEYIDADSSTESFDFITTPKQLYVTTISGATSDDEYYQSRFTLDGTMLGWGSCYAIAAVNIGIIDPVTFELWKSNRAYYNHRNYPDCQTSSAVNSFYAFTAYDSTQLSGMARLLTDSVPDDYYVVAFTFISGKFASWTEEAFQAFEDLGAVNIRNVENNYPYIFFAQKGDVSTAREVIGISSSSSIELYQDLETNYSEGTITSTTIGPSYDYNTLIWDCDEPDAGDSSALSIYGITNGDEEILLASDITEKEITQLDTIADADDYPYLKFVFFTYDEDNRTPSQLKKWQVYYDEAPETAIIMDDNYFFYDDTLQQGDSLGLCLASKNIGSVDMDSLLVRHTIIDASNKKIYSEDHRLNSDHKVDSIAVDTFYYSTANLEGDYMIKTEFNPTNSTTGYYDQIEHYHVNNIYLKSFMVEEDNENPLLDVTFDGMHIMDGDIVSATPEIIITLEDENEYFSLNDTSLFEITLENEDGEETRIYFGAVTDDYSIQIDSTSEDGNVCIVMFYPNLQDDGIYTLNVQAYDKTGNAAGDYDYTISFEIINEAAISNVINYPNPFTTSTRFVFTLTGTEIPTDFRIQIFTISGILVKEIDLSASEDIHVGKNITDYSWDGYDMYGDRLANGVYIYKVIAKNGSEELPHYSTDLDQYFVKGFGKMYLMK